MTFKEFDRKSPMAHILVTERLSGTLNVLGNLIMVVPQLKNYQPMAAVQFPDGIEYIEPEKIVNPHSIKSGQLSLL